MVANDEIREVVENTMQGIIPYINERSWFMDCLYKHSIGSKLPRGKKFDSFRIIERQSLWFESIKKSQWQIINCEFSDRISPLVLSQMQVMFYASIYGYCNLQIDNVLNMIKFLEGDENYTFPNSTNMTKHRIPFDSSGLFSGYEHSHIGLLPNSYLSMYGKPKNIKSIAEGADEFGAINLEEVDRVVQSTAPHNQGRRQTGHWLITKEVEGQLYYLGVFPHSFKGYDDSWIYRKLQEGVQLWKN